MILNFFEETEYSRYIKIIKLICYFLSTCIHHVGRSSQAPDIMYRLVYSDDFMNIMHTYIPEFLRILHIQDLLILFINLTPFLSRTTLLIQIRVWSMLLFQEIQKKKYSFKALLGYIISGNKLLMQALIEHPNFSCIINETISTSNAKITYNTIKKIAEDIVYPKKHHPDNITRSQYQFIAMTHKTIHLHKHTRKVL